MVYKLNKLRFKKLIKDDIQKGKSCTCGVSLLSPKSTATDRYLNVQCFDWHKLNIIIKMPFAMGLLWLLTNALCLAAGHDDIPTSKVVTIPHFYQIISLRIPSWDQGWNRRVPDGDRWAN